jgi:hypothetical protein
VEWILPFCVDITVGVTAPILTWRIWDHPSPMLWGLVLAWSFYGMYDLINQIVVNRLTPSGQYSRSTVFLVIVMLIQISAMCMLFTDGVFHKYFGLGTEMPDIEHFHDYMFKPINTIKIDYAVPSQ